MVGIAASAAALFILVKFVTNDEIVLKWKIILIAVALIFKFAFVGLISVIGTFLPVMLMFLMLRWHGSKIR
ncbi:MAG: hypothetical protein K9N09_03320 [Candidatus Cloacimonetes bacterium]|nr:hypothetical protein [Candidatus Cloacimonadota bacterium]MCF7813414.1 hypothetical protein [Candidatus Cloacimonadota bacterium]MCF7867707.1 hypothetical protein [Candidatus Cloacimonadota bacterium]MCF7883207.1 hypothetical protein [Candidatus Cloacimonadota bacterium]